MNLDSATVRILWNALWECEGIPHDGDLQVPIFSYYRARRRAQYWALARTAARVRDGAKALCATARTCAGASRRKCTVYDS